jgi:MFS family permease
MAASTGSRCRCRQPRARATSRRSLPSLALNPSASPPARGTPALDVRSLWILLTGNALTEIGIGFFLPILPLFVRYRGGGPALVGIIFASGGVAKAIAQYPAGWLSDRYGRRPLIVGSLLVYALLFPLYVLPMPVALLAALRFFHAMAGGAYVPSAMALAADLSTPDQRPKVYSQLRASDMLGLLLGPALGGLVAGFRLDAVFIAGAVICLSAALLMLRLPSATAPHREAASQPAEQPDAGPLSILVRLLPVLTLGAAMGWVFGTYDAVWSLYISSRGASPLVVGLSFATYALPIVLLAGLAGGLASRLGNLRAGTIAALTYGLLGACYPFIASVPVLVLLGTVEGALTAAGQPALSAETSRLAPPGAQGRTQGVYQLGLNMAMVAGSLAGGFLYGLSPAHAFLGSSAISLVGVMASLLLRRRRSAG